jgi:glycosyltransferase involved in cell wall biosynthesis
MKIIITAPSLNTNQNVSGISSVTRFLIQNNKSVEYKHFELGKKDGDKRNISWFIRNIITYFKWIFLIVSMGRALVHFNMAVDKNGLLRDSPLILFTKILNKRLVLHFHGGEYLLHKKVPRWMNLILKLTLSGKNSVIVLSNKEAEIIKRKYKCNNVFVLPNCIDLKEAKEFKRDIYDGVLKILFMGRISKSKGIEYIFVALDNLKREGYLFEFYLAGKGPDEPEYIKKFMDSLGENFIFKGVVSGERKRDLLKECNVFLLPSFFEGLPISLLETMSFGLVPIVTPVGSIKDIIDDGKNGLIAGVKSVSDIENALKLLYNDFNYRKAISEHAREHIFLNYDPGKYIQALNKIYCNE